MAEAVALTDPEAEAVADTVRVPEPLLDGLLLADSDPVADNVPDTETVAL